jgi:hypothetical protein
MSNRVSIDDLRLAAEWCAEGYEGHENGSDNDNVESLARVAAWMRQEIQRREIDQTTRRIARLLEGTGRQANVPAIRAKARELVEKDAEPREKPQRPTLWYGRGS